jgi:hypothetical protein
VKWRSRGDFYFLDLDSLGKVGAFGRIRGVLKTILSPAVSIKTREPSAISLVTILIESGSKISR